MLWNMNSVKNRQHENSLPVELAQPKANVRSFSVPKTCTETASNISEYAVSLRELAKQEHS